MILEATDIIEANSRKQAIDESLRKDLSYAPGVAANPRTPTLDA